MNQKNRENPRYRGTFASNSKGELGWTGKTLLSFSGNSACCAIVQREEQIPKNTETRENGQGSDPSGGLTDELYSTVYVLNDEGGYDKIYHLNYENTDAKDLFPSEKTSVWEKLGPEFGWGPCCKKEQQIVDKIDGGVEVVQVDHDMWAGMCSTLALALTFLVSAICHFWGDWYDESNCLCTIANYTCCLRCIFRHWTPPPAPAPNTPRPANVGPCQHFCQEQIGRRCENNACCIRAIFVILFLVSLVCLIPIAAVHGLN